MAGDVKKKSQIDIKFKQIKELLEIINHKVRGVEVQQSIIAEQVRTIKDQQSVMNDKLDDHTASLMKIEDMLEGYANMYKINKEEIQRLEERIGTIEESLSLPQK